MLYHDNDSDDNDSEHDLRAWCRTETMRSITELATSPDGTVDLPFVVIQTQHAESLIAKLSTSDDRALASDYKLLVPSVAGNCRVLQEDARRLVRRLTRTLESIEDAVTGTFDGIATPSPVGDGPKNADSADSADGNGLNDHNDHSTGHNDTSSEPSDTTLTGSQHHRMELVDAALSDPGSELHRMLINKINYSAREIMMCKNGLSASITVTTSLREWYASVLAAWNQSSVLYLPETMVKTGSITIYDVVIEPLFNDVHNEWDDGITAKEQCTRALRLLLLCEQNARMRHLLRMTPVAYPGLIDHNAVSALISGDYSVCSSIAAAVSEHSDVDSDAVSDAVNEYSDEGNAGNDTDSEAVRARMSVTAGWQDILNDASPLSDDKDATWLQWSVDGYSEGLDAMRLYDALADMLSILTGISA